LQEETLSSVLLPNCPLIVSELYHYKAAILCFKGFVYSVVDQFKTLQMIFFFFLPVSESIWVILTLNFQRSAAHLKVQTGELHSL